MTLIRRANSLIFCLFIGWYTSVRILEVRSKGREGEGQEEERPASVTFQGCRRRQEDRGRKE